MPLKALLLSAALILAFPAMALAQTQKAGDGTVLKSSTANTAGSPVQEWIKAENALLDTLSDQDKESFFILRNKHSIIRVIDVVKRDVGSAVKSCGDKNPKMKSRMDTRFGEWTSAVMPIVETAQKSLDRELSTQKIVPEQQARAILKLNDAAYAFSEAQTKKIPVTSQEACQGLLDSMDRTEDEMVSLLQETLLPGSVIKKRHDNSVKSQTLAPKTAE